MQSVEKQMEIDSLKHLAYINLKKIHGILRIKYELKLYGSSFSSCPGTSIVAPTKGWIVSRQSPCP